MKKAEIISIGDELLIGQVVNTNAAWIGKELNLIGIAVHQVSVVSDDRGHILQSLKDAEQRVDIILITGGLGPTKDDITKQTLCEYFNSSLVFDQKTFEDITRLFKSRGFTMTKLNRMQAEIPANCKAITNNNGTAPGMWFERNGKIFISMPGVPFEMKPMMEDHILPALIKVAGTGAIVHKTILTQGVGESFLAEKIQPWEETLPENLKLAYLPQPGIVRLRLSAYGDNKDQLTALINEQTQKLQLLIDDFIYGYDDETLEGIIGKLLTERKQTLVTAESCTGGYIAHRITSVPGSSSYYAGSIISYSNEIKIQLLDVPKSSIEQHGAVSEDVVKTMAANARMKLGADFAVAVSGIAGPDGGTEEKPMGTTWIAVASPEKVVAKKFFFGDNRERNIHRTAMTALNMLRKTILEIK